AGAYFASRPRYDLWIQEIETAAASGDDGAVRRACVRTMSLHASTRERLGVLDSFYAACFDGIEPVRSALDVACGLNPLSIPWMGLDGSAVYFAYDVHLDLALFLNRFLAATGVNGEATAVDVSATPPAREADVALLLKALPLFEHLEKG